MQQQGWIRYYAKQNKPDPKRIRTDWFYLYKIAEKAKLIYSHRKQISGGGGEMTKKAGNFWGDENVPYLDCGDGYTVYTFLKTHQNTYLIWVKFKGRHFIVCWLHLKRSWFSKWWSLLKVHAPLKRWCIPRLIFYISFMITVFL